MDRRFNVHEAASILGITPEAVRARIQRGTLRKEKDADGSVYVRLNDDQSRSNGDDTGGGVRSNGDQTGDGSPPLETADPALVDALQERIEHLSKIIDTRDEEIRRRDTIIMTLSQRIPELEAPSQAPLEPRDGPETASDPSTEGEVQKEDTGEPRRSWWRRFFLGG